jgi:solute carrier family 12 (sodium/potassium/chloride transporter), member 2
VQQRSMASGDHLMDLFADPSLSQTEAKAARERLRDEYRNNGATSNSQSVVLEAYGTATDPMEMDAGMMDIKTTTETDSRGSRPRPQSASLSTDTFGDIAPELYTYKTVSTATTYRRPSIGEMLYGKTSKLFQNSSLYTPGPGPEESAGATAGGRGGGGGAAADSEGDLADVTAPSESVRRFGMWDGVFARCLLNIFGVIMFLRLGFCVALAGVGMTTAVIVISTIIVTLTTLSLSAISTNGDVKGGGAYFLISRSLGPRFGGAIGVLFTIANAIAVALYLVGFAETIVEQMSFEISSGGTWDLRIYGFISLAFIFVLCLVGVDWVIKVQLALLVVLVACILGVIIGACTKSRDDSIAFTGVSSTTFNANWGADYQGKDFAFVLSIFFPAVTGIMAGANISGELKKPAYDIPVGTLMSVGVSSVVYVVLGFILGASVERDGPGEEGLRNNFLIMADIAFAPLIFAGIYAATLSSAIASLVGAPRILQAVAEDNLFPFLARFAELRGVKQEPVNGYIVTVIIAAACVLVGDLNAIAPLITGFFMISYAFINVACFLASYTRSPGWRPSFKYYNKWLALLGAALCFMMLFLLNWMFGLVTVVLGGALYKYIDHTDPNVSWGSAVEASKYRAALERMSKLETMKAHVKNFRPQLLVFSGELQQRKGLVAFSQYLRKSGGAIMYGNVLVADVSDIRSRATHEALERYNELKKHSSLQELGFPIRNAFHDAVIAPDLLNGTMSLLQLAGMSKMRPNVVLFGFRENWQERDNAEAYVGMIRAGFLFHMGVMVLRRWSRITFDVDKAGDEDPDADFVDLDEIDDEKNELAERYAEDVDVDVDGDDGGDGGNVGGDVDTDQKSSELDESQHILENQLTSTDDELAIEMARMQKEQQNSDVDEDYDGNDAEDDDKEHYGTGDSGADAGAGAGAGADADAGAGAGAGAGDDIADADPKHHGTGADADSNSDDEDDTEIVDVHDLHLDESVGISAEEAAAAVAEMRRVENTSHRAKGRHQRRSSVFFQDSEDDSDSEKFDSFIDVWWLADDGGLSLLVPYLLQLHRKWRTSQLRVMTITINKAMERGFADMATMLTKLRIKAKIVCVNMRVSSTGVEPCSDNIWQHYLSLNPPVRQQDQLPARVRRHLKVAELVQKYSKDARLVVVTMPVPEMSLDAGEYLRWLDCLSCGSTPTLMIRGNHDNVLTFEL